MSRYRDLEAMIEILGLAIARQEAEEEFFRRSATASTSDVARALFAEIADDLKGYVGSLERRRERLEEALETLRRSDGK